MILRFTLFLIFCGILFAQISLNDPELTFPLQFSANIQITAHLIDDNLDFPPRYKRMTVFYDYINKKARADIESGFEAAKYYIRRYDIENEYMIRLPPISDCKRSYLGEDMLFPEVPDYVYAGESVVNNVKCNYFLHEELTSRIHMYMSIEDGAPVQLVQESLEGDSITTLLTYDYSDVTLGAPDESWFELPEEHSHDTTCVRHVAGFPYLHIFHYFVRF
jgi:hypothetical protein